MPSKTWSRKIYKRSLRLAGCLSKTVPMDTNPPPAQYNAIEPMDVEDEELVITPQQEQYLKNINQVADGSVSFVTVFGTPKGLVGSQIDCCKRCYDNIRRNQVPAAARVNNMHVPRSPDVITTLTDVEARMISRAKAFLKIHKLSKGRGQSVLHGQVIHFAQSVEEVQEQPRLGPNSTHGTIIISETVPAFLDIYDSPKW
ncbi:hypothetical protein Fcan01_06059 [Folsomia candida]|uniref:DUF6570 domain-containing protein n=1 Tax=Folsomia candida TaxID=158441 RepID=A0A226ES39_FOLCA|nr:hypothetical protein Fcan01_06059 [Folsomia candida]